MKLKRNKLLIGIAFMSTMFITCLSFIQTKSFTETDILLNENLEALSSSDTEVGLPVECYDRYQSYGSNPKRFRPCDTSGCNHIWAYKPSKTTICPNAN